MDSKKPLPEKEWFTHSTVICGIRVDVSVETTDSPSRLKPKSWDTFSIMFTPLDDPELTCIDLVKNRDANTLKSELELALKRDIPRLRELSVKDSNERFFARGGFSDYRCELVLRLPPGLALPGHNEHAMRVMNDDRHRVVEAIGRRLDMLLKRHGPLAPSKELRQMGNAVNKQLGEVCWSLDARYEAAPRKERREMGEKLDAFSERMIRSRSVTGKAYYAQWPDGRHDEPQESPYRKGTHER